MQIGFIGLGAVVETAYLPALRRLGDVIDRCQGYDLDCSRALPGIQRCSSLSALLADPLDTLFITTPSLQHLPVLERALASGISRIVVEKPIVANLEQAARLRALLAPPEQAARVLEEVDRLTEDAHHARERCAELRVMIPHATYASYAAVDFLKDAAGADQLRIHIREGGSMEALDFVLRRGYHLALLRYAAEDDDHYIHYCARRGLKMEPVMEFEYRLLTNRDGPLAKHEVKDLSELNHYMEIMHDDFQLPGEDGGDGVRWHVNDSRRIHVYERCSQFSILQQLPSAYMWASPMPQRALDQFHLVLKKCPAQCQVMRDVLVYPDHGALRPEEQAFIDLLHREAALTVK